MNFIKIFKFCVWTCLILSVLGCQPRDFEFEGGRFSLSSYEIERFYHRTSDLRTTLDSLYKWDRIVKEITDQVSLRRSGEDFRLFAYLYSAQKAFADASFQITDAYSGSIDLISLRVLQIFYPNAQIQDLKIDPFSEELTTVLMAKIKDRFLLEERKIHPVRLVNKKGYWKGDSPEGLEIPNMKPWALERANEFQTPPPPSPNDPAWDKHLEEVKKNADRPTNYQMQSLLFWAKMIDPEKSDWILVSQKYMTENEIPFEMQIAARAKLAIALMDALIAVFHDKFFYLVKRPDMRDLSFRPHIETPNHPSYPSAHSTISNAAATVLCYFFPENYKEWTHLANEAGMSRIWAGIHYPIDNQYGKEQGIQVGKAVLFRE